MEVADVIIYADLLMQQLGMDLGSTVKFVFNRKSDDLAIPVKLL